MFADPQSLDDPVGHDDHGSALRYDRLPDAQFVVEELQSEGFVCLEGLIDERWLETARNDIVRLIESEGERYFSVIRPADTPGSPAQELVRDPRLVNLLRSATLSVCPRGVVDREEIYDVLRVVAGPRGAAGSLAFHYDASVITALVPLFIPAGDRMKSGELIVMPNRRPFRSQVLHNLVEKAALQNRFASKLATAAVTKDPKRYIRHLLPGNMYLFWGYRTLHANFPCEPNSLRATMLLHYGNPHGNSVLLNHIRNGRAAFERSRRRRT